MMKISALLTPAVLMTSLVCQAQTPAPAAKPPAPAAAKPRPSPTGGARPVPRINPKLKNPALANETAPESYKVKFVTTKGDMLIAVTRASAPIGADRFWNLVKIGYFTDNYFFRMVPGFVAQFGMSSDPSISAPWSNARIKDDQVRETNKRGTICFAATSEPGSRTTQMFLNLGDNNRLDGMGFAPFGVIVEGMDVVDKLNQEYGEQPQQPAIQQQGGAYLTKNFPRLDKIISAVITDPPPAAAKPAPPKPAAAKPAAAKPTVAPAKPKPIPPAAAPAVK